MHLTQVHMENFKSFGRKLTVPFEPGFTGITGPNGSGKSNIGDAILFVLGPNSPRAIRAGRLTDLIFNGGQAGKPSSYCLVSLHFDNADRTMPVDEDEVVLTRKVKRAPKKGDKDAYNSYFYVNGRASKKKEFVNLLEHARISANGYNITQQGDVLQICQMTPVQRRQILDDIAGVTSFDDKLKQAGKQREQVEDNLERIGIVLEEIERSLKQLEKEKGAAQRYRELQADIGRTKAQMAFRRKDDLEAQIAQVQERITKIQADREKQKVQLEELDGQFKTAQQDFASIEAEIRAEGGEEVEKIQAQVAEARDRMVRLEEKMHFCKEELAGGDEDIAPLRSQLAKAEKELANTRKLEGECEQAHADGAASLASKRKELDAFRERISQSDAGAMNINRELGKLKQEHEAKELELHKAKLEVDRLAERRDAAQRAIEAAQSELAGNKTDLDEVTWELEELRKTAGGSDKREKELRRRLFELQKAQAEFNSQADDLEQRIRRLNRELAELQAQEAAAARQSGGVPPAVQAILKAREDGLIRGVVGTIQELASVDDEFQTALATAAGSNLNAIVVEDDAVAGECIEMLKRTRAGRAKLLPLNKMVPGRPRGQALMKVKKDGCLGFALDLIDFNERYHGAFWNVLGDTLVVQNMDAGRRLMGGVRIVSKDGELFEAGGAMVGGKDNKKKSTGFSSGDRGRMDKALSELSQAEAAHEAAIEGTVRVRKELSELETELASFGREGVGSADRLKELEKRQVKLTETKVLFEAEMKKQQDLLESLNKAASENDAQVQTLEARLTELEKEREAKGTMLLKGSKKEWREAVERLDKEVRELQESVVKTEARKDVATKQAELVQERVNELRKQIEDAGGDRERYEADLKRYKEAHKQASAEVDALMKMEREATKNLKGLSGKRDKLYQDLTDLKAKMEKVQDRMETHYSLMVNQKTKLPSLEEQLGEALVDLKEHPLAEEDQNDVPAFDDLRRSLRNLEASLDRLGPVNMRALEEFEEQSRRKNELDEEVERLHGQRDELERVVEEITTEKTGRFMEVFTAVDENFTEVYKGLSLEGKAYMELEDPKNPFEGGLILKAQPMGKRVTRLDALSGGEKSLTSMAFIFALQRYDPSPFYYFDEVDQNLDAVNSELLAKMIRGNAQFAQFIVVSLRKITLKEARHLYGVTQQTPGQSEIISNFDLANLQEEDDAPSASGGSADGSQTLMVAANGGEEGDPEEGLGDAIKGMISVEVKE